MIKKCIICNKEYETTGKGQKICSNKECKIENRKRWKKLHRQNPEVMQYEKEYSKKYAKRTEVKENKKKTAKKYYESNKEKVLNDVKQYRKNNKEKLRSQDYKRNYGISLKKYNDMLKEQDGVCAICGEKESITDKRTGNIRNLSVDHCHSKGTIRGLLCQKCNHLLGHAKDNLDILASAASYLQQEY